MSGSDELPSVAEVYAIHELVEAEFELTHTGTRAYFPDEKIQGVLDDARRGDDVYERAAVLVKDLPHVHVFEDGNKRTAWVVALEYLERHGIEPELPSEEVERVMKRVNRLGYADIATWIETGRIDDAKLE